MNAHAKQIEKPLVLVGEPKLLEGEIIADRPENRDENGDLAIGLKIVTDLTGLTFASEQEIIRINQRPGEYNLLVSKKERVLKVYKIGFKELTIVLLDVGVNLDRNGVWEIKVSANQETEILPEKLPVEFDISLNNSNGTKLTKGEAVVIINGTRYTSDKKGMLNVELNPGEHRIAINKNGYIEFSTIFTVSYDKINKFNYVLNKPKRIIETVYTDLGLAIPISNKQELVNGQPFVFSMSMDTWFARNFSVPLSFGYGIKDDITYGFINGGGALKIPIVTDVIEIYAGGSLGILMISVKEEVDTGGFNSKGQRVIKEETKENYEPNAHAFAGAKILFNDGAGGIKAEVFNSTSLGMYFDVGISVRIQKSNRK